MFRLVINEPSEWVSWIRRWRDCSRVLRVSCEGVVISYRLVVCWRCCEVKLSWSCRMGSLGSCRIGIGLALVLSSTQIS